MGLHIVMRCASFVCFRRFAIEISVLTVHAIGDRMKNDSANWPDIL